MSSRLVSCNYVFKDLRKPDVQHPLLFGVSFSFIPRYIMVPFRALIFFIEGGFSFSGSYCL